MIRNSVIYVFLICLVLLPAYLLQARTIHVPEDCEYIQSAINLSEDGDTIIVQPGVYHENINFRRKAVTLGSLLIPTQDAAYIDSTVIEGNGRHSIVAFTSREDYNSHLTGFTLRNGSSPGAVYCWQSSPKLSYLRIVGHEYDGDGGGIWLYRSAALISHVEITGCRVQNGGGIYCAFSAAPVIEYTIIHRNIAEDAFGGGVVSLNQSSPYLRCVSIFHNEVFSWEGRGGGVYGDQANLVNCIVWENEPHQVDIHTAWVSYSCIENGRNGVRVGEPRNLHWGDGNIDFDPMWIDPLEGDFRLTWGNFPDDDFSKSPCIDAGDPDTPFDPDGTVADMGAVYFHHGGSISGWVFEDETGRPLTMANVQTANFCTTRTDQNGYFEIPVMAGENIALTASHLGYCDSTVRIDVGLWDTTHVSFRMVKPFITLSNNRIVVEADTNDLRESIITMANEGGIAVQWTVDLQFDDFEGEGWMTIDRNQGDILPGEDIDLFLQLNSDNLRRQRYRGTLIFHYHTCRATVHVPVNFYVGDPSGIYPGGSDSNRATTSLSTFPNPFNDTADIVLKTGSHAVYSVIIFDNRGREVRTESFSGHSPGGSMIIPFGRDLSQGTYYLSLETPDFSTTRKVIKIR